MRLLQDTIPELAARRPHTVVLVDEVESFAVRRTSASFETNPVDVHRATDAVMLGIEVKALLVGQGVEEEVHADMVSMLESQGEIEKVLNMVTLQMGADVMVAVKARMKPTGGEEKLIAAVNRAAGTARNPRTGETVARAASKTCRFRVGEGLKTALNG